MDSEGKFQTLKYDFKFLPVQLDERDAEEGQTLQNQKSKFKGKIFLFFWQRYIKYSCFYSYTLLESLSKK